MSVVVEKQDQIKDLLEKTRKDIEGLNKKEPSQREKAIRKIESNIDNLQGLIESFEFDRLELETENASQAAPFKKIGVELEKQYAELKKFYEKRKNPQFVEEEEKPDATALNFKSNISIQYLKWFS
jgi:hypothetical protein